ncbi:MAG: TrkA family potassium uptake protein [Anaerolineae bacterium]|nr:TrkA family potassium uptake protein [Anaerolineae bacterium]
MAHRQVNSEFAVIGLGRFGASVAKALTERGLTVLGIDLNMQIVQELADEITQTVALDATDQDALSAVDIGLYPIVIVSIGNDFEDKILTTLALKALGVQRVICSAANEREKMILLKIGADEIVLPEYDSGRRLALGLAMPSLLDYLPLGRGYSISELELPADFVGKTVRDADLRIEFGLTLVAIRRGEEVIISPPADEIYRQGDQLVLIGKVADLDRLAERA